ncbi:fumarylacetoacetate hydrolase family protein [Gemmobacter serpentinus]|uniref:fumarylacetoacetate hydrolase family protein n=1 Tax=Gemmobacter serpentinus TaxID=2652247 RepID=UPI00124EC39D|nr:fumarylacetoacetate hydrolase family protein [Gemmobacter serpentinus]
MDYVFPPTAPPSLAVLGQSARFPLRRIFCVGRNYAEHAREMGHDPDREPPFFFTKPADALVVSGATIPYPPQTEDLHFEAELVVAIGKGGADIAVDRALDHVFGYAAGNDLTRRDLQAAAKAARRPWDMAKGFDRSAVVGAIHPGQAVPQGVIRCIVAGATRQEADLSTMIWPVADVIAYLSSLVRLEAGDLIMTGTPAGVGALQRGETCVVEIEGLSPATVTIA